MPGRLRETRRRQLRFFGKVRGPLVDIEVGGLTMQVPAKHLVDPVIIIMTFHRSLSPKPLAFMDLAICFRARRSLPLIACGERPSTLDIFS